ncbi:MULTISPECIES: ABC transporter ATP-binding protein [Pandoraea]|uniref:ABC transporter ATP-binding protein n=1 Tax=Pandoraea TaxID=93217 RepID=UPI001F5C2598|nr:MULTISPECIES: ABC transporter ATP-binding protein [Pandoraea]MCI3207978.1 glycerol-3-phosphate ABC transporter ATP-binding protein [Pandoraea sp. LA3]MDN4586007.1 glycerol-3-phosphate ABC transporter ATP-binding protein [Pandoraea capi]
MAGVVLENVCRRFGAHAAIENIDLTVGEGEFVALVGPSGCGKSTLLRMIAGLDWPDEGAIRIGGREVTGVAAAERNVAMVFQNYALYPHLSVRQNIATPLTMRQLTAWERLPLLWRGSAASRARRSQIDAEVHEVAQALGLGHVLDLKPGALSGGQRQRVALGRAIVRQPAAFLYDEPLSNLDAELRTSMRTEIADLHRRIGVASVYVTHDQVEAMTMADRIAVMRAGRILQFDSPAQLYAQPSCIEVARTIGTPCIGLLPAKVLAGGGGLSIGLHSVLPLRVGQSAGADVTVGFRAEHLQLATTDAAGTLPARVLNVEYLGADVLVHVAVAAGQPGHSEARLVVRVAGIDCRGRTPVKGEWLGVSADFDRVLVFDADGQRIDAMPHDTALRQQVAHG